MGLLQIESATELPGDLMQIDAVAESTVALDLLISKADYYSLDVNEPHFAISDPDFNKHYVEAQSEVVVDVQLSLTADLETSTRPVSGTRSAGPAGSQPDGGMGA